MTGNSRKLSRWLTCAALAACLGICACTRARAQEEPVHWAYAAFFGTGHYSLDGRADTTILSVAPGWTWREPVLSASGKRSPGYRFRFPLAIGSHDFSSFDTIGGLGLESVGTVSVAPGVDIEIPMTPSWSVKALAYAGIGTETAGGENARVFRLGFRSQLTFGLGDTRLQLVNGIGRFGYSTTAGASSAINVLLTGLDFGRPLASLKIGSDPAAIHWHVLYTRYLDTLGFDLSARTLAPVTLREEWELGFAFSKQNARLGIKRLRFDRIGLAYRFAADGHFSGVGLVFTSLFDR